MVCVTRSGDGEANSLFLWEGWDNENREGGSLIGLDWIGRQVKYKYSELQHSALGSEM